MGLLSDTTASPSNSGYSSDSGEESRRKQLEKNSIQQQLQRHLREQKLSARDQEELGIIVHVTSDSSRNSPLDSPSATEESNVDTDSGRRGQGASQSQTASEGEEASPTRRGIYSKPVARAGTYDPNDFGKS